MGIKLKSKIIIFFSDSLVLFDSCAFHNNTNFMILDISAVSLAIQKIQFSSNSIVDFRFIRGYFIELVPVSDLSFVPFHCSASYPGPWCFYSMAVRESCLRNGNRKEHEIFQQYTLMFNDKRSVSLLHLPFLQYPGAHKFSHRWPQL